jgi:WD40 repeat protein
LAGGGWEVEGWEKRSVANPHIRIRGGEVRVWEVASGRPRGEPLRLLGMLVRGVAWAPDGRSLAVGGYLPAASGTTTLAGLLPFGADRAAVGGVALVWDLAGGKVQGPQMLHADAVTAVAFHPKDPVLATACADGVVRLWDAQTHLRRSTQMRHPDSVNSLAFSRDGRVLATGSGTHRGTRTGPGEARLWDTATGQLLVQPLVHRVENECDKVHAVALSPDGRALATVSEDGSAWLWDVAGAPTSQVVLHSPYPGFQLHFSPDGRTLLMRDQGEVDGSSGLRLLDAVTGAPTGVVLTLPTAIMAPRFSPDGARFLAVSHRDSKKEHLLRLWETATGKPVGIPALVSQGVTWASFSADGKTLWTAGTDGKLRSWDSLTFAPRGGPLDHGNAIAWADVSPDGRRAVTASREGGVVRLWDLVEGKPIGEPLLGEGARPTDGRFLPGGRVVVTVAHRWEAWHDCWRHDAEDGRPLGPPLDDRWLYRHLADLQLVHPDGRSFLTLAAGDGKKVLRFLQQWDSLIGQPRGVSPPFPAAAAAFHPSGRFIGLAASENARLWSLDVGKPIGPPLPHPLSEGVAFHPSGRLLATWGSPDRTARLWKVSDPVTGSPAEVKRRVEALTGQELDEAGVAQDLNCHELEKRRQQMEGLAPWKP